MATPENILVKVAGQNLFLPILESWSKCCCLNEAEVTESRKIMAEDVENKDQEENSDGTKILKFWKILMYY